MKVRKIALAFAIVLIAVGLGMVIFAVVNLNFENETDVNSTTEPVSSTAPITTERITETVAETKPVTEPSTMKATESKSKVIEATALKDVKLWEKFTPICQYPELPTGCEITSLTMVLRYNGFIFKKESLSDKYLDKGEVGKVDPRVAFEGNPRDGDSYGCYAPVIVNTANKYLAKKNSKLRARELKGVSFNKLFKYTDADIPVIIWCTYKLQQGHFSVTWNVDGKDITWYTPEHCMVLLGQKGGKAIVADPIYGKIKAYDKKLLEKRYTELFKQAVIIY